MNCKQKKFRDFFGKEIKIGDNILHMWATVINGRTIHGESAIRHKKAKVIKFTPKGVGIEWIKNKEKKHSTIFNTRNRIIILTDGNILLDEESIRNEALKEYASYKKGLLTRVSNLKKENEWRAQEIDRITQEKRLLEHKIEELTNNLHELNNKTYRFQIMDFEE